MFMHIDVFSFPYSSSVFDGAKGKGKIKVVIDTEKWSLSLLATFAP